MADVPEWRAKGAWFDVCKCSIPCPCTFAQAPSEGDCEGILAWHIDKGHYGDVSLSGLSIVALSHFTGTSGREPARTARWQSTSTLEPTSPSGRRSR